MVLTGSVRGWKHQVFLLSLGLLVVASGTQRLLLAQSRAPAGRQITPAALEIDAEAHRLYAADADRNQLLLLDLKTGQQTSIPVGKRPIGVALDTVAHRGYVVNAGSGNVSVVDLQAQKVVATVPTDTHPYAIAVDSTLHRVYVSNVFSNQVTVIDGRSNEVTALKAGSQDSLLVEPQSHKVWLCSYESDHLGLLNEADSSIRLIPSSNHVWALMPGLVRGEIFAVSIGSDELLRIHPDAKLTKIKVGSMPDALAIDHGLRRIYVANYAGSSVTVLDGTTLKVITTLPVGHTPQALILDTLRHRAYVANTHDRTVSVLDTGTDRVIQTVPVTGFPYQLRLDPKSGDVFAATFGSSPFQKVFAGGN